MGTQFPEDLRPALGQARHDLLVAIVGISADPAIDSALSRPRFAIVDVTEQHTHTVRFFGEDGRLSERHASTTNHFRVVVL